MAKRRDKYGRFKGKGGIKAYKSNLKGKKRGPVKRKRTPPGQVSTKKKGTSKKKLSKKAKVGVAALYVGAAAFGAYSARPRHFR